MPKAEKGSVKDIAKRIKSKGLQKLKFYCQVCHKQCRDANGFKCHIQSESHLRQMKLFSENASSRMDQYSRDFEAIYLQQLRTRHSTSVVNANNVYQEIIQDKHHIHMNSTMWATLSDFVKYLGKKGKCVVTETERGWYVQYIEQDASKLQRQENLLKRQEAEREAEQVYNKRLQQQRIEAAKAYDRAVKNESDETGQGLIDEDGTIGAVKATKLERTTDEPGSIIQVDLKKAIKTDTGKKSKKRKAGSQKSSIFDNDDDSESDEEKDEPPRGPELPTINLPKPSAFLKSKAESAPREENDERRGSKEKKPRPGDIKHEDKPLSSWLHEDILVRIVTKKPLSFLDDKGEKVKQSFYKRKAIVDRVKYKSVVDNPKDGDQKEATALVTILDSSPDANDGGQEISKGLYEDELETVIPKRVPSKVLLVRGKYRGRKATLLACDKVNQTGELELFSSKSSSNSEKGKLLRNVHYDSFSKLA